MVNIIFFFFFLGGGGVWYFVIFILVLLVSFNLYFRGVFIKTIIHYFALVGYKIFCTANSQNAMEASTIK